MLHDVSDIVRGGETNYIMATIRLFLDILNLFVSLLNLLLIFSGQRD
jgi:FtsH-binding integral membrane protein